MSSQITNIYDRLAAITIAYDGVTPTLYSLGTVPNSIESAMLPARLLIPMSNRQREDFAFIAVGTGARVVWTIQDVLLVRAAGQSRGPLDVLRPLVAYTGAYADAMRLWREPGQASAGTRTTLDRVSVDVVTYEWPSGAGLWYWGALATLTISEYLT
jgi:hypothetical protein